MKRFFFDPCLAYKLVELGIVKSRWITAFGTLLENFQIVRSVVWVDVNNSTPVWTFFRKREK